MPETDLDHLMKEKFASLSEDASGGCLILPAADLQNAVQFLSEKYGFDYLMNLAAIDYKDKFGLVYNLYSFKTRKKISLKVILAKDDPRAPSLSRMLPAANWHEREAYDLMGINFIGHPDLQRILLPDDWVGHPLRKDYAKDGLIPMPPV